MVDERPAAYLDEIQRELRVVHNIRLHTATICRYLHSPAPRGLGYSVLVLEHRAMNKYYSERKRFLEAMATKAFPVEQLIFVDEYHKSESVFVPRSLSSSAQVHKCNAGTAHIFLCHGTLTKCVCGAVSAGRNEARRRRGYGFRGQRICLHEPFYDDKCLTLLAACNLHGFVVPACYVAEETIDSMAFVAWVRHYLCPCLGNYALAEPNSVLVLDNVNQHWSPEAVVLIRGKGTEIVFLPPYSPEVRDMPFVQFRNAGFRS